ncbi:MAG: orotate phosphoribosyltransferase [Cytophagaceae bacterium]
MSAEKISSALLKTGAVKLRPESPFKWASGWNSPIYCDNRMTLSFPEVRTLIKNELLSLIKKQFADAEAIAGVATAGIPQGALIADALNLPFIYVRPKPKDHGMENLIEGKITEGQKVVVVEDLISTGGSSLKAVDALRDSKFNVLGMAAIFTYGFTVADENFKKSQVKLFTLTDYSALVKQALEEKLIPQEQLQSLEDWRKDPGNWRKN